MKNKGKLILWNVFIFALLLIITNSISWVVLSYKNYWHKNYSANLPAMINKNYVEIQEEWSNLKTGYKPFIAWKRHPFVGEYINVGQDRNRKTINSKEGKVVRFFGGSTMWGARLEDKNTIPSLFGTCSSKGYKIVNHGESGFNARQELGEMINVFLQKKKTDLVVFYDGVNDVDFLCVSTISISGHKRENQFKKQLMTEKGTQNYFTAKDNFLGLSKELSYKLFLRNTMVVIKSIRRYLFNIAHFPYTCHIDSIRAEKVANNLLNCWKTARVIAKENESEFIAILQPNVYSGNANIDYLQLDRSGLQGENFEAVYKILREKIKEENLEWIYDFASILDGTVNPMYFDFCHLNGDGNLIIAHQICNIVNNSLDN